MKTLILFISLFLMTSLTTTNTHTCTATWYDTTPHNKVNRAHSTAAISRNLINNLGIKIANKHTNKKGSLLLVTNLSNNKIDTVEATDKCAAGPNHIDLSKESFQKISNHKLGKINVIIKKIG